ncbi:MAG: amidohydrolase [Gammaproteobacteria bacterium]|nr:amidohydrolase [Gammaproteobacteria bacterium]
MPAVKFALIQTETHWHDPAANRAMFDQWFAELPADADVVVLPEMWSTGFTMRTAEVAEAMAGPTVTWMREQARAFRKAIAGSVVIREGDACYNRLIWVDATGAVVAYDKRHLFRMAGEHEHYRAGTDRVVVEIGGLRVRLAVCYDLRFPVFLRNRGDYDVLLIVANWPAARQAAWDTLLRARAIENQAYVVGVNRIGTDGAGVAYAGGSVVYDFAGEPRLSAAHDRGVFAAELDGQSLHSHRSAFPAWQDADQFQLKL